MMVHLADVLLLMILAGFVYYGLFSGLIRTAGMFIGIILGAIFASRLYISLFSIIEPVFFGYENLGKVLSFLILFGLISKLADIGFFFVQKIFNIISIIPFLKSINKIGGAALGLIIGSFSIGLALYVISKYAMIDYFIGYWLVDSKLAPLFLGAAKILTPLLPPLLKSIKGLI